jgi:hypothetical protein
LPGLSQAAHRAATQSAAAPVDRNWKRFPAIAQAQDASTIYAIGDIHGDYDKAVKILTAAKLLKEIPAKPEDAQWAGGSAVLVCTGDMIDKGPKAVEVVRLMRALQADAVSSGGRVIITLGNHEAEFLSSTGSAKKPWDFATELRAQNIDPERVAAGTDDQGLGAWMRRLPAAAKVDDWFFSHAGNTHGQTVPQLEIAIEDGVRRQGFAAPILSDDDSILEARMHPVPWWDLPKTTGAAKLKENAKPLGVDYLVAGHQPGKVQFADPVERPRDTPFAYQGTLFLIDTGMSQGVDDAKPAILKITPGKHESAQIIDAAGSASILWKSN